MELPLKYFKKDTIPEDTKATKRATKRLKREASKYTLIGEHLYRRGFSFPLLKCLDTEKFKYVMREVHDGVYGAHIGGRALASKNTRADYYWPTLKSDYSQYFTDIHKAPPEPLHSIMSPLPFHKWGVGILGPFPIALVQIKYLIVVMNYFTKWIEAELITIISAERIRRFY
ncbi:hypothetical protein CR513_52405, partial [Mucuna pruriens]